MKVVEAIVIKIVPYNDTQRIVRTFTKESGYLSFIVPAFLIKKRGEQMHPLQILEIEFEPNERTSFQKMKSAIPLYVSHALYFDIVKMNIALLWAEYLELILRSEKQNEALYNYLSTSITYLDHLEEGIGNYNLYFLYRLTTLVGFKIDALSYHDGHIFNLENGRFYPPTSGKEAIAGPNAARIVYQLISHPLDQLNNIRLNRQCRSILLDIITGYFSLHLNTDFHTKGMEVIRSVFDE